MIFTSWAKKNAMHNLFSTFQEDVHKRMSSVGNGIVGKVLIGASLYIKVGKQNTLASNFEK